jgi:hypothetical protein
MTRAFYQKTLEIFDSLVLRQRVIVGRSAVFCDFPESQLRRLLPPNNPHATRRKVTRSYRMDTGRSAAGNQRRQTQSQSVALAAIDPELLNSASPGREVDNGFNFQQPVAPSTMDNFGLQHGPQKYDGQQYDPQEYGPAEGINYAPYVGHEQLEASLDIGNYDQNFDLNVGFHYGQYQSQVFDNDQQLHPDSHGLGGPQGFGDPPISNHAVDEAHSMYQALPLD